MALSIYSNCETDNPNPTLWPLHDYQSEVADALIGFYDPVDIKIDSLFDTPPTHDILSYTDISNSNLIPSYSDPSILSLPSDDFGFCQCPKRPRSCSDLYQPQSLAFGHSFVGSDTSGWKMMDFVAPPPAEGCIVEKKSGSGGYLSAQSVAARERRKRISEKTQELGRLIPGGNKMNTAEMFQAAFKYVKFLQAQVGILGAIGSVQGSEVPLEVEEHLQVLVTSPTIQEKLYGEGKCIVSKREVEKLAKESEIKSTQVISRDIDRFVRSMG